MPQMAVGTPDPIRTFQDSRGGVNRTAGVRDCRPRAWDTVGGRASGSNLASFEGSISMTGSRSLGSNRNRCGRCVGLATIGAAKALSGGNFARAQDTEFENRSWGVLAKEWICGSGDVGPLFHRRSELGSGAPMSYSGLVGRRTKDSSWPPRPSALGELKSGMKRSHTGFRSRQRRSRLRRRDVARSGCSKCIGPAGSLLVVHFDGCDSERDLSPCSLVCSVLRSASAVQGY